MVSSPIRRDDRDGFTILQSDNLSFVICNLSFCYLLFGPDLSSISRRIF
jgi:hypothetical protein